jgi:5'-3' exonuclease
MARLHEHLKYFVVQKLTNDKLWQGVKVYYSGHEVTIATCHSKLIVQILA